VCIRSPAPWDGSSPVVAVYSTLMHCPALHARAVCLSVLFALITVVEKTNDHGSWLLSYAGVHGAIFNCYKHTVVYGNASDIVVGGPAVFFSSLSVFFTEPGHHRILESSLHLEQIGFF
jgi:hypothetical protein